MKQMFKPDGFVKSDSQFSATSKWISVLVIQSINEHIPYHYGVTIVTIIISYPEESAGIQRVTKLVKVIHENLHGH